MGKAKAEEETYEQFDEQGIGGVSDFLEDVKAKLTYTPLYRLRDAFHQWNTNGLSAIPLVPIVPLVLMDE